jgi:hypothetical protein
MHNQVIQLIALAVVVIGLVSCSLISNQTERSRMIQVETSVRQCLSSGKTIDECKNLRFWL